MILLVPITVSAVLDVVSGATDALATDSGIRRGVGVEGNSFIVKLFGNKPSLRQLNCFNDAQTAVFTGLALLAAWSGLPALVGGGIGLLLVDAALHLRGEKNWRYLIQGGNPNPKQSAFQKFVGFLQWNEDKK